MSESTVPSRTTENEEKNVKQNNDKNVAERVVMKAPPTVSAEEWEAARQQLLVKEIVYRAFFEPGVFGWPEHACRGCSFVADQVAHFAHLNARNTTLAFA